jgi:hypothetical protein
MRRADALATVDALAEYFSKASIAGKSEDAVSFTHKRIFALSQGVSFHLEINQVNAWAEIFYSTRRWEKWGADRARLLLMQSVERVRMRIKMAPDAAFD